jgi:chromosome segregation ATPase
VKLHGDDGFKQAEEKYRRDEAELKLGQGPAGATDLERSLQSRLAEVQKELREASLRNEADRRAAQQKTEQCRVQMAESEAEVAHYKEEAHSLIRSKLLQASQLQQTEEKLKHEQSRLSLMEGQSETMGRERKALQVQLSQTKSDLREARSCNKSELRMLGAPAKDPEIELQQVRQHMQSELRESVARIEKERNAAHVERDAAHVELQEQAMRCREEAAENEQLRREAEQLRREVDDLSQKTAAQESLAQQPEQKLGQDKETLRVPDATDPTREALEARLAQARTEQREVLSRVEAELVEERQRSHKSKGQIAELEKTTAQYKGEFQEMSHLKQMHESRLQQREEQLRQNEARFVSMGELSEATERDRQALQVRLVNAQSELREASSAMEAERLAASRTAQQSRVQVAQFEGQAAHFQEQLQALTEMKQLQQRLLQQAKTELMSMQEQSEVAGKNRAALQSQLARARSELLESTSSFEEERASAQQRTRQYKDLQARLEQAESDLTKAAATVTDSERCAEEVLQNSEGRMAEIEAQRMQFKSQVEMLVKARALQDSQLQEAEVKLKEQARIASMQGQSEQARTAVEGRLKQVQDELKTATKGIEAEQQEARHIAQQARTEVESLESHVAQFKAQADSLMQAKLVQDKELSRNAEELKRRQASIEAAQQRAEAAERDREASRADLEKAQTELREVHGEKRTTEEKLHRSQAFVTALEAQTAQFKEQAGFTFPIVREQESKVAPTQREVVQARISERAKEAEALNCGKCPFSPNAKDADIAHVLRNSLSSMAQAVEGLKGRNLSENPEADSPVKAGSPLHRPPVVGVTITVVKPIQYEYPKSPEKNYDLRIGLHGVVTMVDEDGDLEVEWKGLGKRWLLKQDYASMKMSKLAC